ncbi:MAG: 50S ribosomal protein L21 [Bacteroidales bacterium]|jgi:large subunit ribosomal protein L21|nr:50S ribosomal protein L21 [Bacteroidales bacterium]
MYAIVEIAGQQFRVEKGNKLFVHHLPEKNEGESVEFGNVLLIDNEGAVKVGAPTISGAKVTAKVINPLVKGDKVIVFKKRKRKGYQKKNGHRQQFTQIEVNDIIA